MGNLANPTYISSILNRYNYRAQKKYGQNFLIDNNILSMIVDAADISKEDTLLEIGPGLGTLTEELAKAAKHVVAVEIDDNLIPLLEETLFNYSNVTIINNDILKTDIQDIADRYNNTRPLKVVANLPYYITSPIIMSLLEKRQPITSITVMVQKEVAERMITGPGTKDFGALSLAVQYYTSPKIICDVSPNSFTPRPNVDSTVIKLCVNDTPPVSVISEEVLFDCIRASFNQRRKTLVNGLKNYPKLSLSRELALSAVRTSGFKDDIRGETLSLSDFATLSDNVYKVKQNNM